MARTSIALTRGDTTNGVVRTATVTLISTASFGPTGLTGATGPQGLQGIQGVQGPAATVAVGLTNTGAPGTNASTVNVGTSSAAILDFTIPRGETGTAATIGVGTVTTGAPGSSATITNAGTSGAAVFNFTIPRGDVGATGATGAKGSYVVSVTAPISPLANDVWFNSDDGRTYIYYNDGNTSQWVEFGNANVGTIGGYLAYTPTLTGVTLGNGTSGGRYSQIGKLVNCYGTINFGSTTTVTASNWDISLPVNCRTASVTGFIPFGLAEYFDTSVGILFEGDIIAFGSATGLRLRAPVGATGYTTGMSSTFPFTWATGDRVCFNVTYEAE